MPMNSWTRYFVGCDGCPQEAPEAGYEHSAERRAQNEGFERIDGRWYCPACAPKAKRAAKKARAR